MPVLLVAGCASSSAPTTLPNASASGFSAFNTARSLVAGSPMAKKSPFLWVSHYSNSGGGTMLAYPLPLGKNPTPVQTITLGNVVPGLPSLDDRGNLYVPSGCSFSGHGGSVQVYAPGQSSPFETITNGINCPLGTIVNAQGKLYVSNVYCTGSSYCMGTITEYPAGHTTPSVTINKNLLDPEGLALDGLGDLFIADPYQVDVLELQRGSRTPVRLNLTGLHSPIDVVIDRSRNVYVSDDTLLQNDYVNAVLIYAPGQTTPEAKIGDPDSNKTQTYGLCMNIRQFLYVTYVPNSQQIPSVREYDDPLHNSTPSKTITNGLSQDPVGCAAEEP